MQEQTGKKKQTQHINHYARMRNKIKGELRKDRNARLVMWGAEFEYQIGKRSPKLKNLLPYLDRDLQKKVSSLSMRERVMVCLVGVALFAFPGYLSFVDRYKTDTKRTQDSMNARQSELAEVLLHLRGRLSRGGEVLSVDIEMEDECIRHGRPSL